MIANQRVLAVVPARSGSKGIPDKNLQLLGGVSLIGRAARLLRSSDCAWIDRAIISTDAPAYAAEAEAHVREVLGNGPRRHVLEIELQTA